MACSPTRGAAFFSISRLNACAFALPTFHDPSHLNLVHDDGGEFFNNDSHIFSLCRTVIRRVRGGPQKSDSVLRWIAAH